MALLLTIVGGVLLISVLYGIYYVLHKTLRSNDGVQQGERLDDEETQTNRVTNIVPDDVIESGEAQIDDAQVVRQSTPAADPFRSANSGPFAGRNRADISPERLETSV